MGQSLSASPRYNGRLIGGLRRNLLIEPGKPWQNGTYESFNGKFRDECLAMNWFYSRAHAKVIIERWRNHYNAIRPHSSLEYQTPLELASQ
jgi:putative transposase